MCWVSEMWEHEWYEKYKEPKPMLNVEAANIALRQAKHCYVCTRKLIPSNENSKLVSDRDQYSGKFRGPRVMHVI